MDSKNSDSIYVPFTFEPPKMRKPVSSRQASGMSTPVVFVRNPARVRRREQKTRGCLHKKLLSIKRKTLSFCRVEPDLWLVFGQAQTFYGRNIHSCVACRRPAGQKVMEMAITRKDVDSLVRFACNGVSDREDVRHNNSEDLSRMPPLPCEAILGGVPPCFRRRSDS